LVVSQVIFTNQKVVLGVDRLDYTKGLVHRLKVFEKLLERHPEHIEKVRYMHSWTHFNILIFMTRVAHLLRYMRWVTVPQQAWLRIIYDINPDIIQA
jgi:hypothetical protein